MAKKELKTQKKTRTTTAPSKPKGGSITERIHNTVAMATKNRFQLAKSFADAVHSREWEKLGYSSFKEYIGGEKFVDIEYPAATLYAKVGTVIGDHDISEERAQKIGFSKLIEVARIVTDDTDPTKVEKHLTFAEENNVEEVKDYSARERTKLAARGSVTQSKLIKIRLYGEDSLVWDEAVNKAQSKYSTEDLTSVLIGIMMEYMNASGDKKFTEEVAAKLYDREQLLKEQKKDKAPLSTTKKKTVKKKVAKKKVAAKKTTKKKTTKKKTVSKKEK